MVDQNKILISLYIQWTIPEKIQKQGEDRGVEDMEFPGVSKK